MKAVTAIIGLLCFAIVVVGLLKLYIMGWQVAIKNNFGAVDIMLMTLVHGVLFLLMVYIDNVSSSK